MRHKEIILPSAAILRIDLFTDTAAILVSIVSNSYYGMPRGQIHINLPREHPIMSSETIEIEMAAVSAKRSIDFTERNWARSCYVMRVKKKNTDLVSTRFRIKKYPLWRAYLKSAGSPANSPDTRGRKAYPERKSCGFKNILIRIDGALFACAFCFPNRPFSNSHGWTGSSMEWRLMRANLFKCKLICPH